MAELQRLEETCGSRQGGRQGSLDLLDCHSIKARGQFEDQMYDVDSSITSDFIGEQKKPIGIFGPGSRKDCNRKISNMKGVLNNRKYNLKIWREDK